MPAGGRYTRQNHSERPTGDTAQLAECRDAGLTAGSEGIDEAKRLGGQCPLLLKPRGGADPEPAGGAAATSQSYLTPRQSTARRRRGKSKFVHHRLRAHAVDELSGVPGVYPGQQSNKRGYTMFTTPNRRRYRRPVRRPQGQSGSCVFWGGARTNVRPNRGIMPAHGGGARATPASTRGHMWGKRTHPNAGANRS